MKAAGGVAGVAAMAAGGVMVAATVVAIAESASVTGEVMDRCGMVRRCRGGRGHE
jgi:hypothetical protein